MAEVDQRILREFLAFLKEKEKQKKLEKYKRIEKEADSSHNSSKEYRFQKRLKKYNMTENEYNQFLETQNGNCALCKVSPAVVIDHNHTTLKVRGLLCKKCNLILGYIETTFVELNLEDILAYLQRG